MHHKEAYFLPIAGLVGNALIWGAMWWPLKELHGAGWHPLWSTAAIFLLSTIGLLIVKRNALSDFLAAPSLWLIACTAGVTNGAFSWAMAIGDVVRVILLFYLMPVWAVIFARILLKERISGLSIVRIGLALGGAALVLRPDGAGIPLPSGLADWLGVTGGMAFALNNVLIRRAAGQRRSGRAFAMFVGGLVIPAAVALGLTMAAVISAPPAPAGSELLLAAALSAAVLVANLALQYGAARLPANITAVVMLVEVVFAALSSWILGASALTLSMMAGGGLIIAASLLAVCVTPRGAGSESDRLAGNTA